MPGVAKNEGQVHLDSAGGMNSRRAMASFRKPFADKADDLQFGWGQSGWPKPTVGRLRLPPLRAA